MFIVQVFFVSPDGTENMDPRPPFRIRLPKTIKSSTNALPGNKKAKISSMSDVPIEDSDSEKEKFVVEAYTPPDPGPYPQDQPRQNSVRFTPTQVLFILLPICDVPFSCSSMLNFIHIYLFVYYYCFFKGVQPVYDALYH